MRLRYGYVVKCVGMKDGVVHCTHYPDSRSGSPGAEKYKVKGNIHWVSARHAHAAKVHLYDRLFRAPEPGKTANSWKTSSRLAPHRRSAGRAELGEPGLPPALPVRAPWLLHRRLRPAVVQPDGNAQGLLEQIMTHPKWKFDGVRVVHSNELDINTPQTPGMDRAAAITHARAGAEKLWAGTVVIHPKAKTGAHHHGPVESVIYVVSGKARMRWGENLEFMPRPGRGTSSTSALRTAPGDQRERHRAALLRALSQRTGAGRGQPAGLAGGRETGGSPLGGRSPQEKGWPRA